MTITQDEGGYYIADIHLPIGDNGIDISGCGHTETWACHRALMKLWAVRSALFAVLVYEYSDALRACEVIITEALNNARARERAA